MQIVRFQSFLAAAYLCIAIVLLSNVHAMPYNQCDNFDCSGNSHCEVVANIPFCMCNKYFTGEHCETMISRRCYFYPNAPDEKQIGGVGECPEPLDQWRCLPDNYYCHFYSCADSIGWCIKATGTFSHTDTNRGTLTRDEDFNSHFFP